MMYQNLHTHSTYCDGKDSLEEMIVYAMEHGFDSIGFSSHSYMHFSPKSTMTIAGTESYKSEVRELASKYAGRMKVYCGLELELNSEVDLEGYDYIIGAYHYFKLGDEYVGFDRKAAEVQHVIDTRFGGDFLAYAKEYYANIVKLGEIGVVDIVGHFDLLVKNCDALASLDCSLPAYRRYALEAAEELSRTVGIFEVNTGAIARGYRRTPYPDPFIIKALKTFGSRLILSSDCHDKHNLACGFEESIELIKSCGFKEIWRLEDGQFVPQPI
jgi:histidinol-phosphatase (PHP family)